MLNKSTIEGRLTRDPELRNVGEDKYVCNITIACDRPTKNKITDFIPVTLWGQQAKYCAEYAKKGYLVSVLARAQSRTVETKDGGKWNVVELVADTYNGFNIIARPRGQQNAEVKENNNINTYDVNQDFNGSTYNEEQYFNSGVSEFNDFASSLNIGDFGGF